MASLGPPKMTPALRRWLQHLADEGPSRRPRGAAGYRAMQAGWTDWWVIYQPTGEQVLYREHRTAHPEALFDAYDDIANLEAITPAGRAALASTTPQSSDE